MSAILTPGTTYSIELAAWKTTRKAVYLGMHESPIETKNANGELAHRFQWLFENGSMQRILTINVPDGMYAVDKQKVTVYPNAGLPDGSVCFKDNKKSLGLEIIVAYLRQQGAVYQG